MVKNPPSNAGDGYKRLRFGPWVRKIPWSRKWQPSPVFLPRESHGPRRWASPWGGKESDTHKPRLRRLTNASNQKQAGIIAGNTIEICWC